MKTKKSPAGIKKGGEKPPKAQTVATTKKGTSTSANSVKNKKTAMIFALIKTLGIVTTASELAHVSRQTHYKWMDRDPKYAQRVRELEEITLDFAESKLHQLISKGDVASTIFYLKTKGKARGYIERKEITGEDGKPLIPKRQVMIIAGVEVEFN